MTLRQELVKEVARKIDKWNWPIWEAAAMDKVNYDRFEDCLIEQVEIDGVMTPVKKFPIYWDSDNAIWQQVEEFLLATHSGNYGAWRVYTKDLSHRGMIRLIGDIRKQLRYKIVK